MGDENDLNNVDNYLFKNNSANVGKGVETKCLFQLPFPRGGVTYPTGWGGGVSQDSRMHPRRGITFPSSLTRSH